MSVNFGILTPQNVCLDRINDKTPVTRKSYVITLFPYFVNLTHHIIRLTDVHRFRFTVIRSSSNYEKKPSCKGREMY